MKISLKILCIALLSTFWMNSYGQFSTEVGDSTENLILYNRMRTFGMMVHDRGLGFKYRQGKRVSIFKTRLWEIEGVYMSSYKQKKLLNPYFTNARRYVYGKLNDLFFLRGGIAWKKLLNDKPYWGGDEVRGVEVRFLYGAGLTLGITKPYYLYVLYFYEVSPGYYNYNIKTEKFNPSQTSWDDVYGRAPFTKGLNEIKLHPGIYFKAGLNFEFGKNDTRIKALEIGATIDVMPTGPQIISFQSNRWVYPTLYLSYSFGKRYNVY